MNTLTTPTIGITTENRTEPEIEITTSPEVQEVATTPEIKPRARLLNLNVDELQNFAIALHNETNASQKKKHLTDLSDVNLDVDDDEEPRILPVEHKHKDMPEKFYANLQAPFHPLMTAERGSEEMDTCKENEITYKVRQNCIYLAVVDSISTFESFTHEMMIKNCFIVEIENLQPSTIFEIFLSSKYGTFKVWY